MRGDENGIILNKAEVALLLAHADKESKTLDCVAFSASINAVEAFASDGVCAVACTGDNDGFRENADTVQQWRVVLPFLEAVKKALGTKDFVRLQFNGSSLTEAVILELLEDDEPILEERQTVQWHEDACDHQAQFPFAGAQAACKKLENDRGVPQGIAPRFLKRLGLMAALDTAEIQIRSGKRASDGVMAIATTSDESEWVCRIMPRGDEAIAEKRKDRETDDRQPELVG